MRKSKSANPPPPTLVISSTAPVSDRRRLQTVFLGRRLGSLDPAVLAAISELAFSTLEGAR